MVPKNEIFFFRQYPWWERGFDRRAPTGLASGELIRETGFQESYLFLGEWCDVIWHMFDYTIQKWNIKIWRGFFFSCFDLDMLIYPDGTCEKRVWMVVSDGVSSMQLAWKSSCSWKDEENAEKFEVWMEHLARSTILRSLHQGLSASCSTCTAVLLPSLAFLSKHVTVIAAWKLYFFWEERLVFWMLWFTSGISVPVWRLDFGHQWISKFQGNATWYLTHLKADE